MWNSVSPFTAGPGAIIEDLGMSSQRHAVAKLSQLRPRVRFHKPYIYTMEPGSDRSSGAKLSIKQAPFSAEGFASTGALL